MLLDLSRSLSFCSGVRLAAASRMAGMIFLASSGCSLTQAWRSSGDMALSLSTCSLSSGWSLRKSSRFLGVTSLFCARCMSFSRSSGCSFIQVWRSSGVMAFNFSSCSLSSGWSLRNSARLSAAGLADWLRSMSFSRSSGCSLKNVRRSSGDIALIFSSCSLSSGWFLAASSRASGARTLRAGCSGGGTTGLVSAWAAATRVARERMRARRGRGMGDGG